MTGQLIGVRQCSDGRVLPVFAEVKDALSHHLAVVSAHGAGPFLPAAFGAGEDRLAAIGSWLESRQDVLAARFAASEGLVEMGLRLTFTIPAGAPAPAASGRDFLRKASARSAAAADGRRRIDHILVAAAALPGVARWRVLSDEDRLVSAALAVRREAGASVAAALEGMAGDGLIVETSGPWPLYSFGLSEMLPREIAA